MKTMTTPNPVEEAKKHTKTLDIPETVEELRRRKTELKASFGDALPVEKSNQKSVSAEIVALDHKINDRTIAERFPNARIFLPQEPLGWRDTDGMPVLAPFGLDSPECIFVHRQDTGPNSVRKFYVDVNKKLRRKTVLIFQPVISIALFTLMSALEAWGITVNDISGRSSFFIGIICGFFNALIAVAYFVFGKGGQHYQIKAVFNGLIPRPARTVIKKAQECKLFTEVFLLTEVPKWDISLAPKPVSSWADDPLVIAFDGEKHWLIDSFNVTPVEMMAAGYTEAPPKS